MAEKDKNKIQAELEKLSWEFVAEISSQQTEDDPNQELFLEDELEEDILKASQGEGGGRTLDINEFNNFVKADVGNAGSLDLDEDKLEEYKIDKWHIPTDLKTSWYKAVFNLIKAVCLAPVKFFRWLAKSAAFLVKYIFQLGFRLIKIILVLGWELVLAFKQAIVYLFGDFGWLKPKLDFLAGGQRSQENIFAVKYLKRVSVFIVLALLVVVPFKIYSIYYRSAEIKGEVLGAAETGWAYLERAGYASQGFDFDSAVEHFRLARQNFKQAEEKMNFLGSMSNSLVNLIPEAKQAKRVMKSAKLFAQAGERLAKVMQVLFESKAAVAIGDLSNATEINQLHQISLELAQSEMNLAVQDAQQAAVILNKVDLNDLQLSQQQRQQIEAVKINLPNVLSWLKEGRDIMQILGYILGMDEQRRLMLVFQNNSELRPSGGFMGSYAIVDIKDAKIKKIDVPGGGFYDLKGSLLVKVDAPYPFHLFSPIWQPWNANWFYDWPTSAQKIEWFYDKSGGPTVDGVIAFTPNVVEDLLRVIGEIDMPEYGVVVSADNFVKVTQQQVELEYDKQENKPKKFIGDLMPKLLERLAKLNKDQLVALWQIAQNNLATKHLLVYINDNLIQEKVAKLNWAGQVKNNRYDYLAIVHTNVAGGKTDRVIKKSLNYQINVLKGGRLEVELILTKEHQGDPEDIFERQTNIDYIRFYVPRGSQLVSAEGFDGMPQDRVFQTDDDTIIDPLLAKIEKNLRVDETNGTRITEEFGKTVFANWMIVAVGEKKQVKFKYILPFKYDDIKHVKESGLELSWWQRIKNYFRPRKPQSLVKPKVYSLLLQKQPGVEQMQVEVNFNLAPDYKLKEFYPQAAIESNNRSVKYKFNLMTDSYLRFIFE